MNPLGETILYGARRHLMFVTPDLIRGPATPASAEEEAGSRLKAGMTGRKEMTRGGSGPGGAVAGDDVGVSGHGLGFAAVEQFERFHIFA